MFLKATPVDQSCNEMRPSMCLPNSGNLLKWELATLLAQAFEEKSSSTVNIPFK
jgi:hypothetical protein